MSASSASRGAAQTRSASSRASGSVPAITRQTVAADGASQRPPALRHAPSARSSRRLRPAANCAAATGPESPASRASAQIDSTVSRRCLRPCPRRLSGSPANTSRSDRSSAGA